ncbi:sensor domain-containing protein [Mycobacterium sp. NPDC049093]
MATLSVVFAFLFAPVGAVLGHLGLSQIKRTGQRGRDRALVGLSLSYTLIVVAVAALVIWAVIPSSSSSTATEAKSTAPTATPSPVTTTTTTTTTPEPPPLPLVTEAQLPGLLLNLDDSIRLVGLNDGYSTFDLTALRTAAESISAPPQCFPVIASGSPDIFANSGYTATHDRSFGSVDVKTMLIRGILDERATLYADASAASRQVDAIEKVWQGCRGTVTHTTPAGPVVYDVGTVTRSATNSSIVLVSSAVMEGQLVGQHAARAVVAKSNVVIDVVFMSPDPGGRAEAVTAEILSRVPG